MAARKRAAATAVTETNKPDPEKPKPETQKTDSSIRLAKPITIFKIFLIFSIP
ncbi:hypothetical protein CASFOL_025503 [Castilleja foliolosa]|uniref:Uncharacterized protein n=1 Tax=Castilleja foliolosa TaxID=1961234 RepID=A0ABD3CSH8_9LAMI